MQAPLLDTKFNFIHKIQSHISNNSTKISLGLTFFKILFTLEREPRDCYALILFKLQGFATYE